MANDELLMTQAAPGGGSAASPLDGDGAMIGRMLNVSRLATIGEIAAGIAHELNQPLTAISNYSQACERLLNQPDVDTGTLRMALEEITGQAVRASQIVGRLRTLARNHEMRRTSTDVNAMINEIAPLAGADTRSHDVRLVLELAADLPAVALDGAQIQHVILNLVRNAADALGAAPTENREIRVRSGLSPAGELEICVCDNGPGVTADLRSMVFDPFFSTKKGGTGLGLPISNSIVRAHGGTLDYRPNEPCGACFFIRLPIENAA